MRRKNIREVRCCVTDNCCNPRCACALRVFEAKCLGVWWKHNLSAVWYVQENISKARRAFFAFGRIDAFQGHLNPLSSINIVETCVIPVLLYGCDTWLLDSSAILLLEQFQYEIGRRILKLQNNTVLLVKLCDYA